MISGKKYLYFFGLIAILLTLLFVLYFKIHSKFIKAIEVAKIDYENSRKNLNCLPESYIFVTHGITFNMTEQDVDHLMRNANKTEKTEQLFYEKGGNIQNTWKGYIKLYQFDYGEKYVNPFTKEKKTIIQEDFRVYFDPNGLAEKMSRLIFRMDKKILDEVEIDLKNKTLK